MFARASAKLFGSSSSAGHSSHKLTVDHDDEGLLDEVQELVQPDTLAAFTGSSELPTGSPAEVRALFRRYLLAEKRDVGKTVARLVQQADWRRQFGTVTLAQVPAEVACGKSILQPAAPGAPGGRPLLCTRVRHHVVSGKAALAEMERFVVLVLDTASSYCWSAANGEGKMIAMFDLAEIGMKNLSLAAVRSAFGILERHFPERLAVLYMLDAPAIFTATWHLIEPFIDPTSRAKLQFISGAAGRATLLKEVGAETLPLEYGGKAQPVPIEEAVRRLPAWQEEQRLQLDEVQLQDEPAAGAAAVQAAS